MTRDDDIGDAEDPGAATFDRGLVVAERIDQGCSVLPPPEVRHRVDAIVGADDERRVLMGVARRQPQLAVGGEEVAVALVVQPRSSR